MFEWHCEEVTEFGPCGFETSGWPTQKLADLRGQEHLDEHSRVASFLERQAAGELEEDEVVEPMRELMEFQKEHNVWPVSSNSGAAE